MLTRFGIAPTMLAVVILLTGPIAPLAHATEATPPAATPTTGPTTLSVYFLRQERRGPRLGAAHREPNAETDAAESAMRELLQGPTQLETDAGLTTAVPSGTTLLNVEIDNRRKLASVDLSSAFAPEGQEVDVASLAQVVFTLTQFPHIEHVAISVEGTRLPLRDADGIALSGPAARTNYDHLTPLIFLESPAPGDTITSPVQLWGTANTFEATFVAEVQDAAGTVLTSQIVTATSGNGVRGTFDLTLTFAPNGATSGHVVVYENSARDGARQNEVVVPVNFGTTS